MVRFLCFNAPIHSPKPKKTAQSSGDVMHAATKEFAKLQSPNDQSNLSVSKRGDVTQNNSNVKHDERTWKTQEMEGVGSHQTGSLRKTQSLGNILLIEGSEATENETNNGLKNQRYYCDNSHLQVESAGGGKNVGKNSPSQLQEVVYSESIQVSSDVVNKKSIFLDGDSFNSEIEGHENFDCQESGDCGGKSESYSPQTPSMIVKSPSVPITGASAASDGGHSPLLYRVSQSRSSEELQILNMKQKDLSIDQIQEQEITEEQKGSPKSNSENNSDCDHDESHTYSKKDWIMPVMDEGTTVRSIQEEISVHQGNEISSNKYKIKRIEEWVDSIQNCGPMLETSDLLYTENETTMDRDVLNGLNSAKADTKVSPGIEAAKRYISTLSATASSAQLANHGLVSTPLLSAFASLRVLNLSGNAIVRITAGTLPRGLHVLNLSKNNISTIEGLRELTRLRVLDLSFNRIIRIGHGLANCSSLKELYLAGNKISEVDGLHRLLKLIVLDLRFNKISTTKCLDHLAANYNSLQAISLEGNPAQRNIGDEQLKKHLQGLLPHLVYYNRQPIKVGSLKDAADRSVRLVTTANQVDRGLRSDHKTTWKTNSSLPSHKVSSLSAHGQRNYSAISPSRQSKGKRAPLRPPLVSDQRHYYGYFSKQLNLKPDILMPRSRSEGKLGAF